MAEPERIPPEQRTIDLANASQVQEIARAHCVDPADVAEAVQQVGPNRIAVELWLGSPDA